MFLSLVRTGDPACVVMVPRPKGSQRASERCGLSPGTHSRAWALWAASSTSGKCRQELGALQRESRAVRGQTTAKPLGKGVVSPGTVLDCPARPPEEQGGASLRAFPRSHGCRTPFTFPGWSRWGHVGQMLLDHRTWRKTSRSLCNSNPQIRTD